MTIAKSLLTIRDDDGNNSTREQFKVGELLDLEALTDWPDGKPPLMRQTFEAWKNAERGGFVREENFHLNPGMGVSHYKIDVGHGNPLLYRYTAFNGLYVAGLEETAVGDHPHQYMIGWMAAEYHQCKVGRQPSAFHLTHDAGGFRRDYFRLLLPVCDRRGRVTALACVARHLALPDGSLRATRP